MIAWLRRIFGPRRRLTLGLPAPYRLATPEMTEDRRAAVMSKIADATAELNQSELESRAALVELNRALLRAPGAAHRPDPIVVRGRPIDWSDHIADIEALAREQVETAQRERDEAVNALEGARLGYQRSSEAKDREMATWRGLAEQRRHELNAAHSALTDAKVPPKATLADRVEWLVASRQRARDARDTRKR